MTERVLVKNTADEEQVKAADVKERFERDQIVEDIKTVMETREGRRVLWHFLGMSGLDSISADYESVQWTYFREGQRNLGLNMKAALIEASLENYQLMELEAIKRGVNHGRSNQSRR